MECGAILDVCEKLQVIEVSLFQNGKTLLIRVVSMLTKMCQKD